MIAFFPVFQFLDDVAVHCRLYNRASVNMDLKTHGSVFLHPECGSSKNASDFAICIRVFPTLWKVCDQHCFNGREKSLAAVRMRRGLERGEIYSPLFLWHLPL